MKCLRKPSIVNSTCLPHQLDYKLLENRSQTSLVYTQRFTAPRTFLGMIGCSEKYAEVSQTSLNLLGQKKQGRVVQVNVKHMMVDLLKEQEKNISTFELNKGSELDEKK